MRTRVQWRSDAHLIASGAGSRNLRNPWNLGRKHRRRARNRSKTAPGRHPGASGIVPKSIWGPSWSTQASWKRPGSTSGRPQIAPSVAQESSRSGQERSRASKRAPGITQERAGATKIDGKSLPGAKKSIYVDAHRAQSIFRAIFRQFSSILEFWANPANPLK